MKLTTIKHFPGGRSFIVKDGTLGTGRPATYRDVFGKGKRWAPKRGFWYRLGLRKK